ncbi:cytochrome P450 [Aspergillus eucalypticola CBS 122712]|uniref:Cytochrome P450 n=1 Tax=Aspergillus eucalypticola (strain CBS 122712 / IBT 29274) TaxID=1448314 RepID=A0A317UU02_ASPEC|nr:cytochrome P450 [Aspergillus eucalypticola CBS 122712]PWY63982.1 cytochrome P450 [Aspergillus eucalypticola CBS 122712]
MEFHLYSILTLLATTAGVFRFILYPAFFSPLAKIPNAHWSCSFSPLWILWMKWSKQENREVYKHHMEKGPVVRLGPSLVSVNCFEDGLKRIYHGGFPKPDFYFNGFAVYGTGNLFTIKDNAAHAAQKKALANCFSKSSIMSSQSVRAASRDVLFRRLLPLLYNAANLNKPVEVLELNYSYLLDTFVQWQFGQSLRSNLVEDEKERRFYLDGFLGISKYTFWQYEFPGLINMLQKIGIHLIPKSVINAFEGVENWNLEKCDQAQQLLASREQLSLDDHPVVFEQALKGMSEVTSKPKAYPRRLPLASEMFSLNSGAFETSGNTSTYLLYELSRHPEWQKKLQEELRSLSPSLKYIPGKVVEIDDMTNPQDIDKLPILHAVLMETLRLWPSVPGGQPRVVPWPCTLGGYHNIPTGTIVQSYASVLHRMPDVFPDPHEWKPDRWLNASPEELAIMRKWFWGFGSGGRMCLGLHFAYYSIKFLFASIYSNFTTTIHDHGDMEPSDGYLSCPKGHRLELRFHLLQ